MSREAMKKLLDSHADGRAAYRDHLEAIRQRLPDLYEGRADSPDNLVELMTRMIREANWLEDRLRTLVSTEVSATSAGLERRRAALAAAEAAGDKELCEDLRGQLAALGQPVDTPQNVPNVVDGRPVGDPPERVAAIGLAGSVKHPSAEPGEALGFAAAPDPGDVNPSAAGGAAGKAGE